MIIRRSLSSLGIFALLCLAEPRAFAHAIIVEASPAARSTVAAGDIPIEIKFNSRVDRARSRLALIDARGAVVKLDLAESSAERMSALATAVVPGNYRIEWYVLSIDGHITRGNIKFSVSTTGP